MAKGKKQADGGGMVFAERVIRLGDFRAHPRNYNRHPAGQIELNESVLATIKLLYEVDPDGVLCNVDRKTHRILTMVPWGRSGWKHWGLRYWEAEILRSILRVRTEMRRVPPLFDWNEYSMKWHLNFGDYGRLDLALMHWKANHVTLKDWRTYADAYRKRAQQRMEKHRDKG